MDMNQGMNPYGTPMSSAPAPVGGDFMAQLRQWMQQNPGGSQLTGSPVSGGAAMPGSVGLPGAPAGPSSMPSMPGGGQMPGGGTWGAGPAPGGGGNQLTDPFFTGGAPGAAGPGQAMNPGAMQAMMQQLMGGGQAPPPAAPNYSPAGGYGTMSTAMQAPQMYQMNQSAMMPGAGGAQPNQMKPGSFDPNAVPGGSPPGGSYPVPGAGVTAGSSDPAAAFANGAGAPGGNGGGASFAGSWMNAIPGMDGSPNFAPKTQMS